MTEQLKTRIRQMLAPAKPTEAEVQQVIAGWDAFFASVGCANIHDPNVPAYQRHRFEDIMRARVQHGSISLIAPGAPPVRHTSPGQRVRL